MQRKRLIAIALLLAPANILYAQLASGLSLDGGVGQVGSSAWLRQSRFAPSLRYASPFAALHAEGMLSERAGVLSLDRASVTGSVASKSMAGFRLSTDAALDRKCSAQRRVPPFVPHERKGAVLDIQDVISRYYLRLSVVDKPGTLAKIAAILGQSRIGISSVIQPEGHEGESVPLILMIHDAPNSAMTRALKRISALGVVKAEPVMIRVETFD